MKNAQETTHPPIYEPPPWSGVPPIPWFLDVLRLGSAIEEYTLDKKEYFLVGSDKESVDIFYGHPLVSRSHAVFQFNSKGELFVADLRSTHGTWVGDKKLEPFSYEALVSGSVLKFATQMSKRTFLVREAADSLLPFLGSPKEQESETEREKPGLFDSEGNLIRSARAALLEREGGYGTEELKAEEAVERSKEALLKHYDPIRAILNCEEALRDPLLEGLTQAQRDAIHSIKKNQEKKTKGEGDESQHILAELLRSFEGPLGAASLSAATREALDSRQFDESDDFFDRAHNASSLKLSSLDSLEHKLGALEAQIESESEVVRQLSEDQKGGDEEEEDVLDLFMRENQKSLENNKLDTLRKEADFVKTKIADLKKNEQSAPSENAPTKGGSESQSKTSRAARLASKVVAQIANSHAEKKRKLAELVDDDEEDEGALF